MILPLPMFTAPAYGDRTLNEVQRCVNLYPEKTATGWKLVGAPGLALVATATNNEPYRGAYYTTTGTTLSVNAGKLYQVNQGPFTEIGNLSTTSGDVRFCDNGLKVLIVDGTDGYIYDLVATTLTTIADGNFPGSPNWCCFKDGYFIVTEEGSDTFYLSQLNDPSDWTPATSAIAESNGDNLKACVVVGNEVLFIGLRTIEPWYNTGNASFPFERVTGAIKQMGTAEPRTIAVSNGTLFMVVVGDGLEPSVWAISSGGAQKVSTPYIDSMVMNGVLNGFVYQHEGHVFYQINQITRSLVYDITEGAWHERDSNVSSAYTANRIMHVLNRADNTPFAFDRVNGNVYFLVNTTNTEDGTAIRRLRVFGPIEAAGRRVFHSRIKFALKIDHDSTASYTLSATLDWTDDGGLSWSTARTMSSKPITSGTTAQYVTLAENRLGSSYQRYYRLTFTGPAARLVLQSADLKYDLGVN